MPTKIIKENTMWDTVGIYKITHEEINTEKMKLDYFKHIPETGEAIPIYRLGNLYIKKFSSAVSIHGSLPRYIWGNNFNPVYSYLTKAVIRKLEYEIGISLDDAIVTRLDVVNNLPLDYPLPNYTQYLVDSNNLKKRDFNNGNGLTFNNKTRATDLYDKLDEMGKMDSTFLTPKYHKKYILRYEYQMKRDLDRILKVGEVKVKMLSESWFANKAMEVWKLNFQKIKKICDVPSDIILDLNSTTKDINSFLILKSLTPEVLSNIFGKIDSITDIENASKNKRVVDNKKHYLKNHLRKLIELSNDKGTKPDFISELEEKIEQIVEERKNFDKLINKFDSKVSGHVYFN
ncbi:MAG: hypothetical protein ACYC25_02655 [Paludibacter sp.]